MVTEDDTANVAADAAMDQAADAIGDATNVLESLNPDDADSVAWIKQQPLPYPAVSTKVAVHKHWCREWGDRQGIVMQDALEPYISKETVEQHWGVHQHMHVDRLNGMIGGSEWERMSIGQMMLASFNEGREPPHAPFFHAAQVAFHAVWKACVCFRSLIIGHAM